MIGVLSSRVVVYVVCEVAIIGLSCFTDSTNHSVEALCSQFLLFARGAGVIACALWRWRKHANERQRQQERGGRMGRQRSAVV